MKIVKLVKMTAVSAVLLGATSANAVISGSLHDLTLGTANSISATDGSGGDQLCVYCHTPHAASADFANAPLWNKGTMPAGAFTMYGNGAGGSGTTIAGTAPDATPNDPSLACLSCHDGVSAINSVVNAPGSGLGSGTWAFQGLEAGGVMPAAGVTNIGRDLSNDHPVSIVYTPGKASLNPLATVLTTQGDGTAWDGATTVADLLRGAASDRVECSSCHDPHLGENITFLRNPNAGSTLCLGCHAK